jgi:hypothetical protein
MTEATKPMLHIPHWMAIKLMVQMEENIQAAEITILTIKHVTVATPCNKVTINSNSTTVVKKLSGPHEECTLYPKMTFWTFCVTTRASHKPLQSQIAI